MSISVRIQVSYGTRTNFTQMRHAGDVEMRTMLLENDFFDSNVDEHQRRFSAWYNGIGASPCQRQYANDVRATTVWWQPTFKFQVTDAVDVAMWDEKLARGCVYLSWQKLWVRERYMNVKLTGGTTKITQFRNSLLTLLAMLKHMTDLCTSHVQLMIQSNLFSTDTKCWMRIHISAVTQSN